MATLRPRTTEPDLSPGTIAVLLSGWCARPPVPDSHGFGGGFLELYDAGARGIVRLWTAHRAYLLTVAATWKWTPRYRLGDKLLWYAELCATVGHEPALSEETYAVSPAPGDDEADDGD